MVNFEPSVTEQLNSRESLNTKQHLKMWTLPAGRWIFLLSLTFVMIFSISEVDSFNPVAETCCANVSMVKIPRIKVCYEQFPRPDCNYHAFLIINKKGKKRCISTKAQWLQDLIAKDKLRCEPL